MTAQAVVLDTSTAVPMLINREEGPAIRQAVGMAEVFAPSHMAIEVVNVLRKHVRNHGLSAATAEAALDHVDMLGIHWVDSRLLMREAWRLRDNASAYDAAYIAIASQIGGVVLSRDARLARAFPSLVRVV